jgi:hypothetical protein
MQTSDGGKRVTAVVKYLLRSSQPRNEDPYAPGLRILASVLTEAASKQKA